MQCAATNCGRACRPYDSSAKEGKNMAVKKAKKKKR
jgi:hypothetical protein